MKAKFASLYLAALVLPAAVTAQTVTVNKGGTGNYTSIGDAITAVEADAALPNMVQVTDSAKYEETLTITQPLILEAIQQEKPTILVNSNLSGSLENGGIVINLPNTITTGTVEIRNFEVLPSRTTLGLPVRTAIESRNNNIFLWIDNCLITANDGADEPLVTDGLESRIYELIPTQPVYNANIVQWGDDGIVLGRATDGAFEGDGTELLFNDSIITHLRNDFNSNPTASDCNAIEVASAYTFNMVPPLPADFRLTRIEGASAISFARRGLFVTGDLIMQSSGDRIRMRGFAGEAIHLVGHAPNTRAVNDTIIEGSSSQGIWDQGVGTVRCSMKNSIIYYIANHVLRVGKPSNYTAEGLITIEECTLVGGRTNNTAHTFRMEVGSEVDVLIRNSIIGGKDSLPASGFNVFSLAGNNTVTLEGSSVIQEGPFSLRNTASNPFSLSLTASVVGVATTTADPMFMDSDPVVVDPHLPEFLPPSPDFMNVQNAAYANANAEGGPLGGGAEYVGPPSHVMDWQMY